MEVIFLFRRLIEKFREKRKDLYIVFIDLEKAYDRVPREIIWWALEKKGVQNRYIDLIKDMYEGAITNVRTLVGETSDFTVMMGLHKGSTLGPYLFALIIDELIKHVQEEVPYCMLFADDIVLIDEINEGLNAKFSLWTNVLETRGFKISRTK